MLTDITVANVLHDLLNEADLKIAKVLYDLSIAAITGIFTGLFVDALIKRRERRHLSKARNIMHAMMLDIIQLFVLKIVPFELLEETDNQCVFGDAASSRPLLKYRNADLLVTDTPNNLELKRQIKSVLPDATIYRETVRQLCRLPDSPSTRELAEWMAIHRGGPGPEIEGVTLPFEVKNLREAKQQLDALLQSSGLLLEHDLRAKLAMFDRHVVFTLEFVRKIGNQTRLKEAPFDWDTEGVRDSYADLLLDTLRLADQLQSAIVECGKLRIDTELVGLRVMQQAKAEQNK